MQQEKKLPILPADDAVQNWFEENIDKECSASSAVYKFRLWLESLQREYQVKRQQAIGLGLIEDNPHPSGCEWVKSALQWAKEAIDFTYDYVKVPESLVETWGNMYMNTMNAIQEAQREIESPSKEGNKGREVDGLRLLEFISEVGWGSVGDGEYINHNNGRIIKEQTLLKEFNEWNNQQNRNNENS